MFTGTDEFETKKLEIDVAKFNIYLLNEFMFESLPQMILIVINAYITGTFDTITKTSIVISAIIVGNGLYRLVCKMLLYMFLKNVNNEGLTLTLCVFVSVSVYVIVYLYMCLFIFIGVNARFTGEFSWACRLKTYL